ncbi:MAG: NAD(P)-dependent oxidoreductase [Verrucomicrobia bacterium]|nr:NAD(P)-dependent oxidoreductase [Verrucomicrobiota bacterium]
MRILITGAAGRVGTALRRELAAAGHRLVLADVVPIPKAEGKSLILDISDGQAVRKAMRRIEAVVHLAYGRLWGEDGEIGLIQRCFDVNAKGTFHLLRAAARNKVRRFIYTSSLSALGGSRDLAESQGLNERTTPRPAEPYGFTKYLGEEACRFASRRYGLNVVCLRLCHIRTQEEWDVCRRWRPKSQMGRCQRNMTTHVEDVARAIRLALTAKVSGFTLIHVASDNPGRITSIARARKLLGFHPQHRFED